MDKIIKKAISGDAESTLSQPQEEAKEDLSYQKLAKDSGIGYIVQLLTYLHGVLMIPLLTKSLGAHDYGIWSLLLVAISLLTTLSVLGIPQALERFLPGENDRKGIQECLFSALFIVLFVSLFFSIFFFFFSNSLASILFQEARIAPLLRLSCFIFLLTALNSVILMFFRGRRQFRIMYALELLQLYGGLGLVAYFVLSGFGLFSAFLGLLIVRGFVLVAGLSCIILKIGIRFPGFYHVKSYLAYSLPMIPMAIAYWVIQYSDRYMIAFFTDSTQVGIYSAAYAIGTMIGVFRIPIMTVLPPIIYKFWDENRKDKVKILLQYSLKYYLMIALPAFFGLTVLSKPILSILTKTEFVDSGSIVLPIVALTMLVYGVYGFAGLDFYLQKKTKNLATFWIIASTCNVILNAILIPRLSILGASIATAVSYVVPGICIVLSPRKAKVQIEWAFVLKSVFACSVMFLSIRLLKPLKLIDILLSIALGVFIYIGILILLKGISKEEVKFLRSIL